MNKITIFVNDCDEQQENELLETTSDLFGGCSMFIEDTTEDEYQIKCNEIKCNEVIKEKQCLN